MPSCVLRYCTNNSGNTVKGKGISFHRPTMTESQERVLNEENWHLEAEAAIKDIKRHVKYAAISTTLKNTNDRIYINLTTLEGNRFCIEMSAAGFKVVGKVHDDTTFGTHNDESTIYETPYSLLHVISKKYKESFGGELMSKLMDLAKKEG